MASESKEPHTASLDFYIQQHNVNKIYKERDRNLTHNIH